MELISWQRGIMRYGMKGKAVKLRDEVLEMFVPLLRVSWKLEEVAGVACASCLSRHQLVRCLLQIGFY